MASRITLFMCFFITISLQTMNSSYAARRLLESSEEEGSPEIPKVPEIHFPELPNIPGLPKPELPTLPDIHDIVPQLPDLPKLEIPKIDFPELPKIPFPTVDSEEKPWSDPSSGDMATQLKIYLNMT